MNKIDLADLTAEHPEIIAREWASQAGENVDIWGQQPAALLLLAMQEELGEIADEMVSMDVGDGQPIEDLRAESRLARIRELGDDCQDFLESNFEDEHGDPIPPSARPDLRSEFDRQAAMDELYDLGPLLFQLHWALEGDRP